MYFILPSRSGSPILCTQGSGIVVGSCFMGPGFNLVMYSLFVALAQS